MTEPNKGIAVPGEDESSSLNPDVQDQQRQEKATSLGWKPQTEWQGDPDDWVPAKEFLARNKIHQKVKDLKSELYKQRKSFERDLAVIQDQFAKQEKAAYDRAKKELREERRAAAQEGDVEAIERVEEQLDELEEKRREQEAAAKKQTNSGPTPEFVEWQETNQWFGTDKELTDEAVVIGTGYAAANPQKSQVEVLEYTEKRIKKMFPEKFEKAPVKRQETDVEGSEGNRPVNNKGKSKTKLTVHDLDDDERRIMRALVSRGVLKKKAEKNKVTQEEQFLNDLAEQKKVK